VPRGAFFIGEIMNTVTCKRCDLVNLDTVTACKRCGTPLEIFMETAGPVGYADGAVYVSETSEMDAVHITEPAHHRTFDPGMHAVPRRLPYGTHTTRKKGLAILSLVLGIIGMPPVSLLVGGLLVGFLAVLFGTTGVVIGGLLILLTIPGGIASGIAAIVKANRNPKTYSGKGIAIAGVAISSVALLTVPMIAAIAIPNFLAARRAANEGSAVAAMQRIASAQLTYAKDVGNGYCAEIPTLGGLTLIDMETAKGELNGYKFYVTSLPGGGCEIHGVPKTLSDGNRSFYFSTADKLLRAGLKEGSPAGQSDPLVSSPGRAPVRQSSAQPPTR
jgi:type II secretory pathway pseudopilin PulG